MLTGEVLIRGRVEAVEASSRRLGGGKIVCRGSVAGDLGATGCVKLMCQVAAAMCNRSPYTAVETESGHIQGRNVYS